MEFSFEVDYRGYLKRRESIDLEYKQNFQFGDIAKYLKTMVGMANNKGGQIVSGIKDKPHLPVGMSNNKFMDCDPAMVEQALRDYFSEEVQWSTSLMRYEDKDFGIISVKESQRKPIVCKKTKDGILREAAVYYRYRGESREIGYAELRTILDKERDKERIMWLQHITAISLAGPQNIHILNSQSGHLTIGDNKVLIDRNLLENVSFIREGQFVEKKGTPTLKLIGEITAVGRNNYMAVPTDRMYPYFTKDLTEQLNLNTHELKCIVWKLSMKGNPKYHTEVKAGPNSNSISKYSEEALTVISDRLTDKRFVANCLEEFKIANPPKPVNRIRKLKHSFSSRQMTIH